MAVREAVAPLTEPRVVDCHYVDGYQIEEREDAVRLVFWTYLETVDGGPLPERRIVGRIVLGNTVTRSLSRDLRKLLTRGEH